MTAPASGNYVIYNRALSSAGDKLAITWTGAIKDPLTVEKLVSNNNQIVCSPPSLLSMSMFSLLVLTITAVDCQRRWVQTRHQPLERP